jgi:hypothetical protein
VAFFIAQINLHNAKPISVKLKLEISPPGVEPSTAQNLKKLAPKHHMQLAFFYDTFNYGQPYCDKHRLSIIKNNNNLNVINRI